MARKEVIDFQEIARKYGILTGKIGDLPYSSLQDLVGECLLYRHI